MQTRRKHRFVWNPILLGTAAAIFAACESSSGPTERPSPEVVFEESFELPPSEDAWATFLGPESSVTHSQLLDFIQLQSGSVAGEGAMLSAQTWFEFEAGYQYQIIFAVEVEAVSAWDGSEAEWGVSLDFGRRSWLRFTLEEQLRFEHVGVRGWGQTDLGAWNPTGRRAFYSIIVDHTGYSAFVNGKLGARLSGESGYVGLHFAPILRLISGGSPRDMKVWSIVVHRVPVGRIAE